MSLNETSASSTPSSGILHIIAQPIHRFVAFSPSSVQRRETSWPAELTVAPRSMSDARDGSASLANLHWAKSFFKFVSNSPSEEVSGKLVELGQYSGNIPPSAPFCGEEVDVKLVRYVTGVELRKAISQGR